MLFREAQAEWHFVVLSYKLSEAYRSDLESISDRIDRLTEYSGAMWEELKEFWNKVNDQVKEKNLFWNHFNSLKELANKNFEKLKDLRKVKNEQFAGVSKKNLELISSKIEGVRSKLSEGRPIHPAI